MKSRLEDLAASFLSGENFLHQLGVYGTYLIASLFWLIILLWVLHTGTQSVYTNVGNVIQFDYAPYDTPSVSPRPESCHTM